MVILGGLEVVAAGYLIHKHNQNKRELARLREAEELIEEEEDLLRREARRRRKEEAKLQQKIQNGQQYLQRPPQYHQPQYSQSQVYLAPPAQPEHRRRRSESRDRKHGHHRRRRDEDDEDRRGRRREHSAPPTPIATQTVVEPGIVTGWPSHWQQAQTPEPKVAPPKYSQASLQVPVDKRRGRSVEDLSTGVYRREEARSDKGSRTPSPRVRFNDGVRPGEERSPPPRYR